MPQGNRMSSMQSRGQHSQGQSQSPQAMARQASDYLHDQIDNHPVTAVLACFAAGLAVGAGLVALSCQSAEHDTASRWGLGTRSQREALTQRISDAVMQAIPAQWRHALS
jgi:hypothetical protein